MKKLVWCLLIGSCNAPGFFNGPQHPRQVKNIKSLPYQEHLSCEKEFQGGFTDPKRARQALEWSLTVEKKCQTTIQKSVLKDVTRPLYIQFVIDLTQSMQPSVDVIRGQLIGLSEHLIDKGYVPYFGVVTFTEKEIVTLGSETRYDKFIEKQGFFSAEDLVLQMDPSKHERWRARYGGDFQEPGMEAIETSLEALQDRLNSDNKSRYGDLILFYVSDGLMYSGENHYDFSTRKLSKIMSDFARSHVSFKVLYSVDENPKGKVPYVLNPEQQFESLVGYAVIDAENLGFPLSRSSFEYFSRNFQPIEADIAAECILSEVHIFQGEKKVTVPMKEAEGRVQLLTPSSTKICMDRCCQTSISDVCEPRSFCLRR